MRGFRGRKVEGKVMWFYYNLKNKRKLGKRHKTKSKGQNKQKQQNEIELLFLYEVSLSQYLVNIVDWHEMSTCLRIFLNQPLFSHIFW